MYVPEPYKANEELEARLGDPRDAAHIISFERSLELDEREDYPTEAHARLDAVGVSLHYVPISDGGRLSQFGELAALFRTVARRDLTLAIAHHITFAGALHVWIAGTAAQRQRIAAHVLSGGAMAIAYHEEAHGSDLLATETAAVAEGSAYRLSGTKWLVNNATRAQVHTTFARTSANGGPRGFSLFIVDRKELPDGAVSPSARLRTHGARGADFSGVRLSNVRLPADAMIGGLGEGLELTLRSFQITRTLIPGLSLGAADTALRTVVGFAGDRKILKTTVLALARPRAGLVDAFADLLLCDCAVTASARALHFATEEMRLWSAVCKSFVAATIDGMLRRLGEILGARSFLRDGHAFAIFQKIVRDHAAIPMFHAGDFLLLQTVGMSLSQVAAFRAGASRIEIERLEQDLVAICALSQAPPPFDPGRLRPFARARDVRRGLELFLEPRAASDWRAGTEDHVARQLEAQVRELCGLARSEDASLETALSSIGAESPELFDRAERYCALHVAALSVQMWAHNRASMDPFLAGGEWLVIGLARQLARLGAVSPVSAEVRERTAQHMISLYEQNRAFSIVPLSLPGPAGPPLSARVNH